MPDECGDKNLIRAAGGQNFDRPCAGLFGVTLYCNKQDYDDWRIRLDEIGENLLSTWNMLVRIENENQAWPKSEEVKDWYNRILERIKELPEASHWGPAAAYNPFAGEEPSKVIAMMVGIATDMVCLLSIMQKAIADYGQKVPPVPHVNPDPRAQVDVGGVAEQATKAAKDIIGELAWPIAIVGSVFLLGPVVAPVLARKFSKGGK